MAENAAPFKKHVSLKMQLRVRGIRLNMKLKALYCKLWILKIILLLYISFHPLNQMYAQVRSFVTWDCDFHEIHKRWWIRKTIKQNRQLYKKWTGGFKNQPEFNYKFESNTIIHCVSSIRYNCIYAHFLL